MRLSIVLTGLFVGCDGTPKEPASASSDNPRAGTRRKEMSEFMKNQSPAAPEKAAPRNHP